VHALMPAVLLRLPRLNAFGHDPQTDPPDRQPRQPGRAQACRNLKGQSLKEKFLRLKGMQNSGDRLPC
jgi:hypothetical protein